jgi:cholesterol transport system auxiliary component
MKEAPVMKTYSFIVPNVSSVSNGQYRNKILKVSYPVALSEKVNNKMYYSYSLSDRGAYMNSRWSNDVGKMLQGDMIQVLAQSGLFKVVVPFASDVKENLRLESSIFDFSHHIRGEASYAIVSVQCTLMNAETGILVKAKRFSYKEYTTTTDARGYAEATNKIMVKFSRDLLLWMR